MAEIREHCWHVDSLVLLSYPAVYGRTCCHCGARVRGRSRLTRRPSGHGPHVVAQPEEGPLVWEDAVECVAREVPDEV